MATTFDEEKLKDILKAALLEALEEHRDLVQDIVDEAMKDFDLARAIEQGLASESVSRDEVFAIRERVVKVGFSESFAKDLKGINDKGLLKRVKELIEIVERAHC